MIDNSLIEWIKILDHADCEKNHAWNQWKKGQFLPIDKRQRKLESRDKIRDQTQFVGQEKDSIDEEKMQCNSEHTKVLHREDQRLKDVFNYSVFRLRCKEKEQKKKADRKWAVSLLF